MSALDKIRAGIRNQTEIFWPGTQEKVRLRVLSKEEILLAIAAAQSRFDFLKIPIAFHTVEAFEDEKTIQMLYRALSDAENGKPLSPSVDVFRATVTKDEASELVQAYEAWEAEVSPNSERMDDAQFASFYEALKKKPEEIAGCVSSIALARRLLVSLASPPTS